LRRVKSVKTLDVVRGTLASIVKLLRATICRTGFSREEASVDATHLAA
jgi:hypothetical protein